jgi:hypothetical protein
MKGKREGERKGGKREAGRKEDRKNLSFNWVKANYYGFKDKRKAQ